MQKKTVPRGRVRPAVPGDIDGIHAIEKESSVNPWARSLFEEEFDEGLSSVFVFCGDRSDEIQGFVVFRKAVDAVDILNIAVRKNVQRRGIGGRLLETVIREAAVHHASAVILEVRTNNIPAIQLYENAGFKKAGIRKNYYSNPVDDAVVLKFDIGGNIY